MAKPHFYYLAAPRKKEDDQKAISFIRSRPLQTLLLLLDFHPTIKIFIHR